LPDSIAQVFDKRPYRSSSKNIVNEVCRMLSVDPDDLHKKGRANDLSSAKGLICYLGYYQLGINGKELARYFGISRPSVSQAIKRGEKQVKSRPASPSPGRENVGGATRQIIGAAG
jgi:DNA-binding Xre family transcriptional regulator